jgi:dTDP-4-dehydrorhamnose 3,5-epimerase
VRFVPTDIPDVLIIEPDVYRDERGYFLETYHADKYRIGGLDGPFLQDNHSHSVAGTLRGLHLQPARPQGKLIRVVAGEIFDVAVDVRRGSPSFGRWVGHMLSAENFRQCWVPPGFAHGFCVVSASADVEYKCTDVYDPAAEIGIAWNDPMIGIRWPVEQPVMSERDRRHPPLAAVMSRLPEWRGRSLSSR